MNLVKDLPISGQPVYLQVNRRQFKCDNCQKPFSEELDFVAKKRTYTKRLAENILEQLKEGDILNVSRRNDVTEEEIQRMIFPEPVIHVAVEPKTKADQEKMGIALNRLAHCAKLCLFVLFLRKEDEIK